jgi:5'-nucleotidase
MFVPSLLFEPKRKSDSLQDIQLAKELAARPSPDPTQHGVDLLLGGHDHLYFVSKGVAAWDGYVIGSESLGTEQDDGVYVIKSGSDFRDLSDMELILEDMPEGSVRRKTIKEIKGGCLHFSYAISLIL